MSFTVKLFEFQKRHNSTRRPEGAEWSISGVLREGSSLITPTISFEFASDFSPMSNSYGLKFNYAYVAKFARYYWITDWSYDAGLWHAAMKVDVLASFRPQILASSAFIAYDSSTPNTDIVDTRLSMLTAIDSHDQRTAMFQKLGQGTSAGGAIVVMCTGKDSTAGFAMDQSTVSQLMNNIVSWGNTTFLAPSGSYPGSSGDPVGLALWNILTTGLDWWKGVVVNLASNGNAAENIRAAVQLPVDIADISGTTQRIILGQYDTTVTAKKISSRLLYDSTEVQIPWNFSDWRNNEPFTEIFLYIPYVGNVKMPNGSLIGETSLRIYAVVDLFSGDAIFRVYAEPSDVIISAYSANIGASYPIGASNISPSQTVTGVAGAVGAIAAGAKMGGAAGAAVGALGAITGIFAANTPNSSSIGGGGGGASQGLNGTCIITVITHDTTPDPADPDYVAIMGTPRMRVGQLANLTGYVETRGAAITGNMTATEHAELNALLDSGVYIETGG